MEDQAITIEIPRPAITSLVFEGGGVKGLVYAGALLVLHEKNGLLDKVRWVAGSSAGAMTALMVALGYTPLEIEAELTKVNFSEFAKSPPSDRLSTIFYILKNAHKISTINHGINDGKKLYQWVGKIVAQKLSSTTASFSELKKIIQSSKAYKNLLVTVTNARTNQTEIFSWETTPDMQIADAILVSMSIPGYFYTRYIDKNKMQKIDWNPTLEKINSQQLTPYVDGGVLNNYPINLFCDQKYWPPEYYGLAESHSFNPASLGLRVDSMEQIKILTVTSKAETNVSSVYQDKSAKLLLSLSKWIIKPNKIVDRIKKILIPFIRTKFAYLLSKLSEQLITPAEMLAITKKFLNLLTSDLTKAAQYSQITIEIEDCGIQTTEFELSEADKNKLKESGKQAANAFYKEFLQKNVYKRLSYSNLAELEDDYNKTKQIIKTIHTLNCKDKALYQYTLPALQLKTRLMKEKILNLTQFDKNTVRTFTEQEVAQQ